MDACRNCGKAISDTYCSSCGQRTDVRAITIGAVYNDVKHSVLHLDHGLLFTLKELYLRPGVTVRAYIDGKRVRYYKPVAMVVLLGGVFALLDHMIAGTYAAHEAPPGSSGDMIEKHYTMAHVLFIPVMSACSYLVFRKWHKNYAEHFVLAAYLFAMKLASDIVTLPVKKLLATATGYEYFILAKLALSVVITTIAYKQYFAGISTWGSIVRSLFVLFLALVIIIMFGVTYGFIFNGAR